ncbi:MAG TPA: glycine betaine ABC transporter substrate-binding protein [Thermomicrobiales bacterium]|nr:glycine betaine ABC transporter substrate-binding protein [Thermomicrobiales bacterium]
MTSLNRRTLIKSSAAGAVIATLAGTPSVFADDGDKPTIGVGSRYFTEQMILGEMVSLVLEDAGYHVKRTLGLGGTAIVMEAIESGEIDISVEYTGTGLVAILEMDLPTVDEDDDKSLEEQVYDIVKREYEEQLDLIWLDPWGFNNTYAMAVSKDTAEKYDLKTTSDLEAHAGDMTLGTDLEFPLRDDGLPGFEEAYGFSFGDVKPGDAGIMYQAVANGDVDVITAYTTDGRIPALDLVVLEDDKGFFPPYYMCPVIRKDTLDANPEVGEALNRLHNQFTESDMQAMNYDVDENGMEPIDVARPVLEEKGLIES